jgi:hypothetical protein
MKRVLSILFQYLLFLILFAAGSFLPALHLLPSIVWHMSATREFVLTGLIVSAVVFGLIMLVHAVRRTHSSAAVNSIIAFLLAVASGLALHFGMLTV